MLFSLAHRLHPEITLPDNRYLEILPEAEKRFRAFLPPGPLESKQGAEHKGAIQHVKVRTPQLHRESVLQLSTLQAILNDKEQITIPDHQGVNDIRITNEGIEKIAEHIREINSLSKEELTSKIVDVMIEQDKKHVTRPGGRTRESRPGDKTTQSTLNRSEAPAMNNRLRFVEYYLRDAHNTPNSTLMDDVLAACRQTYRQKVVHDLTKLAKKHDHANEAE